MTTKISINVDEPELDTFTNGDYMYLVYSDTRILCCLVQVGMYQLQLVSVTSLNRLIDQVIEVDPAVGYITTEDLIRAVRSEIHTPQIAVQRVKSVELNVSL